jgi:hypothetical protein
MTYKTVFDAAQQGSLLFSFPAVGPAIAVVSIILLLNPNPIRKAMGKFFGVTDPKSLGLQLLIFACAWTIVGYALLFEVRNIGEGELCDPKLQIVEGSVENFVPMPYGGHAYESFDVSGHHFSYSDYVLSAGFHNASSHGGPIKAGLRVRLSYLGNDILRVEVAE